MNGNQELQFHSDPVSSNGHSNVTMDQKECEWFPVEGAEENDEIQSRSEDTDENDTSSKEGGYNGNGMEESDGRKVEQGERIEEGNTVEERQENRLLEVLAPTSSGIPELIFSDIVGEKYVIVMEMLGPNLGILFNTCNRRFSLKTVAQLALQLLDRIEFIHSKGLLHRDIKPENVVIGKPDETNIQIRNRLYIVDFGLSKFCLNPVTGTHNPMVSGEEVTGTARYVSLRTQW